MALGSSAACNGEEAAPAAMLSVDELIKPETCKDCHEGHYEEWSGSMHAYAGEDPIFKAMNRRGQEETNGELGDFCVQCHTPLAVAMGNTVDGLNIDQLAPEQRGVTCYFCHNVESISQVHDNPLGLPANNPLQLAMDQTMRGGLTQAVRPGVHDVAYSEMLDGDFPASDEFCGSCHDIVTPAGVHLERTFTEHKSSVFRDTVSCIGCHMESYSGVAVDNADADPDLLARVGLRQSGFLEGLHRHTMPGVDMALTPFPHIEAQRAAIACALRDPVELTMTVTPSRRVDFTIESNVGHGWPTGATQDRRAWVTIKAYDGSGAEIFSEGDIPDNVMVPGRDDSGSPYQMRGYIYKENGDEAHMFWDAAKIDAFPEGYENLSLPPNTGADQSHVFQFSRNLPVATSRIEVHVQIRAVGFDVIDDLVQSGHVSDAEAADFKSKIPTHLLDGTRLVWDMAEGNVIGETIDTPADPQVDCDTWRCMIHPDDPGC